ncbi:hypothetical protein B0H67DRAFT_548107 [Lasiosphaeris hirsuta]|uniref:RanBP2-type domain-containing protein n=1 Tax=Lasiosphaeris hirsuta TaxID=260670 RepID=A0AA40B9H6_9PEZI|nr:hypothetical protein B0H67DRAFT_548107 [Lasiosphaeris hirsuta]
MLSVLFRTARRAAQQYTEPTPTTSGATTPSTPDDDDTSDIDPLEHRRLRQQHRSLRVQFGLPPPPPHNFLPQWPPYFTRAHKEQRWSAFFDYLDGIQAEQRAPTPPPRNPDRSRPHADMANETSTHPPRRRNALGDLRRDADWACCGCSSPNARWEFVCSVCRAHCKGACCEVLREGWRPGGGREVRVVVARPSGEVADGWEVVEGILSRIIALCHGVWVIGYPIGKDACKGTDERSALLQTFVWYGHYGCQ